VVVTDGWMAMQGARNNSAGGLSRRHRRRPGVPIRSHEYREIHTDSGGQEARQARTCTFDLIPYAAAGWQRQLADQSAL
jgi:hypothetical protein